MDRPWRTNRLATTLSWYHHLTLFPFRDSLRHYVYQTHVLRVDVWLHPFCPRWLVLVLFANTLGDTLRDGTLGLGPFLPPRCGCHFEKGRLVGVCRSKEGWLGRMGCGKRRTWCDRWIVDRWNGLQWASWRSFPASIIPTLAASSLFSLHEHDSYFQVGQKIGTTGTLKFTWKENTD